MFDFVGSFFSFITDSSKRLSTRGIMILFVFMVITALDNYLGFSYYYHNEKKISQLKEINELLKDKSSAIPNSTKERLNDLSEDIILHKSVKDRALTFIFKKSTESESQKELDNYKLLMDYHRVAFERYIDSSLKVISVYKISDKNKSTEIQRLLSFNKTLIELNNKNKRNLNGSKGSLYSKARSTLKDTLDFLIDSRTHRGSDSTLPFFPDSVLALKSDKIALSDILYPSRFNSDSLFFHHMFPSWPGKSELSTNVVIHEEDYTESNWHFFTSSWFMLFCIIVMPIITILDKKVSFGRALVLIASQEFVYIPLAWLFPAILGKLPLLGAPWANYTFNIVANIAFIALLYKATQWAKSNKSTNLYS